MSVFEVESWLVAEGKDKEHEEEMRRWLKWVKDHRELFPEWKSLRYFYKHIAGNDSGRYLVIWEYESYSDFEAYKTRRKDYEGPYAEYKENDPYYKGVFIHSRMGYEFWRDMERELWIE
jgi:hypothetical protein